MRLINKPDICLLFFPLFCHPHIYLLYYPTELKEQLLARSSRVDDIERLKSEFNEQKREIKEQNEAELENLRRYEKAIIWEHIY